MPEAIRLSPLTTDRDAVNANEARNVPPLLAVHSVPCVTVTEPPAHPLSVLVPVCVALPAEAVGNAIVARVELPTFAVPAEPGSPVWYWMCVAEFAIESMNAFTLDAAGPAVTA
jgi:hypothetical protein